jgi:hypothetical protein
MPNYSYFDRFPVPPCGNQLVDPGTHAIMQPFSSTFAFPDPQYRFEGTPEIFALVESCSSPFGYSHPSFTYYGSLCNIMFFADHEQESPASLTKPGIMVHLRRHLKLRFKFMTPGQFSSGFGSLDAQSRGSDRNIFRFT